MRPRAADSMFSCRRCGIVKPRKRLVNSTASKPVWTDNNGKRWCGYHCPPCANAVKKRPAKIESYRKRSLETKVRYCRECNKKLPPSRYFACYGCTTQSEDFVFDQYGIIGFDNSVSGGVDHTYGTGEEDV